MNKKTTELLTPNRIDVFFKILYLKLKQFGATSLAEKIYKNHIRIITNGIYTEEGSNKKSYSDYLEEFNDLFISIKKHGFNEYKSTLPLAKNGTITNGAHRLAICAFLKIQSIPVISLNEPQHTYDYNFFFKRGMSKSLIDFAILEFLLITNNNFLAVIWPSADKKIDYLKEFDNLIYEKKIKFNPRGAQSFVAQVYKKHEWVGSFEEGYGGVLNKVNETFRDFSPLHLIFFKATSLKDVLKIKRKLRNIFDIEKSSIHITDNDEETNELSKIVLNKNSLHFLNFALPQKYPSVLRTINLFKEYLIVNNLNFNNVAISGDYVLTIYGMKNYKEINFLTLDNKIVKSKYFKNQNNESDHYNKEISELIYNPENYFYFQGLKFVSLENIILFKSNRNIGFDELDVKLIQKLFKYQKNNISNSIVDFVNNYKYKFIGLMITVTKRIGVYEISKRTYKIIAKYL
jgi:hypothetical protein